MNLPNGRDILFIPEIAGLDARTAIVRIPPDLDVPLTRRVRRIIDSRAFHRLANISQLGFVQFVYPGATHTRFEHSLGVYRITLLLLKRLAHDERFASLVTVKDAETLLLTALLHDIGHFPFCHLIEDIHISSLPVHESLASDYLLGELAPLIREDWGIDPEEIVAILQKRLPRICVNGDRQDINRRKQVFRLLGSILSGPIDVDKMDYLMRDSIAAGVPYGKNYDLERLVGSVCLNEQGDGIAISNKGKTAAELMVFARYVMFSEVYWHHTARAASVMFQRLIYCIMKVWGIQKCFDDFKYLSDNKFKTYLFECCGSVKGHSDSRLSEAKKLYESLFGEQRFLYKRLIQFSAMEEPNLYSRIAGRSFAELQQISALLAKKLGVAPCVLLLDAPSVDKEVEFKIDVFYPEDGKYRALSNVSPVVRALAQEQFDDYVKRVRVFVAPEIVDTLRKRRDIEQLLFQTLNDLFPEF